MIAAPNKIPTLKGINNFKVIKELNDDMIAFLKKYPSIYGSTFQCKLVNENVIFTSNPIWVKHILQTQQKEFGRGRAYEFLKLALGNGLLVNQGESWMRQRRLAQPAFHKRRLNDLFLTMEKRGNQMIDDLELKRGEEISVTDVFWEVTSDIVIESLLGGESKDNRHNLQDSIQQIQEYIIDKIRNPIGSKLSYFNGKTRKFNKLIRDFDVWIYDFIEQQKSNKSDNNLLSMLMEAEDEDTGEKMSNQQLRDELLTIYVAGHETSTYALSWTLYLLGQHPQIMQKVKEEIRTIEDISNIGFHGVYGLKFLNQVLLESMRIYPPAFVFGRKVLNNIEVDNTFLKKGDNVVVNVYALHNDPNIWENPTNFDPERFTPEAQKLRDKFAYIPFGGGPRMCIGNNFAIMEIVMLLAKLICHFDLELTNTQKVETEPLITLRPKQAIKMKLL